ncbi:hypothetical protein GLAREA_09359 [Glarea lozoyensis ATCC 20868]|uniref:Uncharacterized protein n=1 Tax=Glarea lozoyensis (strain ATCC 20868 / MF5171) TaxID=1116229 RepID=S3CT61_GLAL2|nr:uncharacterized protein GLAREA_09359 [Glarea lozoyensis ATCC 20868]EPE28239.1 hypothetical protein GLAREA_09359 [Glarea lozoyensis ATCC 20868]
MANNRELEWGWILNSLKHCTTRDYEEDRIYLEYWHDETTQPAQPIRQSRPPLPQRSQRLQPKYGRERRWRKLLIRRARRSGYFCDKSLVIPTKSCSMYCCCRMLSGNAPLMSGSAGSAQIFTSLPTWANQSSKSELVASRDPSLQWNDLETIPFSTNTPPSPFNSIESQLDGSSDLPLQHEGASSTTSMATIGVRRKGHKPLQTTMKGFIPKSSPGQRRKSKINLVELRSERLLDLRNPHLELSPVGWSVKSTKGDSTKGSVQSVETLGNISLSTGTVPTTTTPNLPAQSRSHPLLEKCEMFDTVSEQFLTNTNPILAAADDECHDPCFTTLLTNDTTQISKNSDLENVSSNAKAPQSNGMSVSEISSRLSFESGLHSNPNTEQTLCASVIQESNLNPSSKIPLCGAQHGQSWSKLSPEHRGETFPIKSVNEYHLQEIPIFRIAQRIERDPPALIWPKNRRDGYWEWDVSKLRGTCTCTEQLMLERTRHLFIWLAAKFLEYARSDEPPRCEECDIWFNIQDCRLISQIDDIRLTSYGCRLTPGCLAAATYTIRKHRPKVFRITVELPIDLKLKIITRSEVSEMVHCFKTLEDMLPRSERLRVIGLENHCRLASRWLSRQRGNRVGYFSSPRDTAPIHGYIRDFRFSSSMDHIVSNHNTLVSDNTLVYRAKSLPHIRGNQK